MSVLEDTNKYLLKLYRPSDSFRIFLFRQCSREERVLNGPLIHIFFWGGCSLFCLTQWNPSSLVWHQSEADITWCVWMETLDLCKQCQNPSGTMGTISTDFGLYNVEVIPVFSQPQLVWALSVSCGMVRVKGWHQVGQLSQSAAQFLIG